MAKWMHKVSLGWLKARQNFLTATDVKDLIPFTKTGRTRKIGDEEYWKVLSRKIVDLTEADCISTGAAARGHILEPYAIKAFNEYTGLELFHWDDTIISSDPDSQTSSYCLAFSPDATDITMHEFRMHPEKKITVIGEVKSYSAEKHIVCGHSDKMDLEERWQIATAMAVLPSIERAFLMFYNPSMNQQLFVFAYSRSDLENEIAVVKEVDKHWQEWLDGVHKPANCWFNDYRTEQMIIAKIMESEKFNPENERSVML